MEQRVHHERNPEVIQKSVTGIIQKGVTAFEALQRIDHDRTTGQGLTADTKEYIMASGISDRQAGLITDALATDKATSMKQYLTYLQSKGDTKNFARGLQAAFESFANISEEEWAKKGIDIYDLAGYFEYLLALNPLVGTSAVLLYKESLDQVKGEESTDKNTMFGWYKNAVEKAVRIDKTVGNFFGAFQAEGPEASLHNQFLADWQKEIRLNVAESLNMASCMAIHIQKENCAVLNSALFLPPGEEYTFQTAGDEVKALGDLNLFKQYSENVLTYKQKPEQGVLVPLYISVIDVKRFFESYENFWSKVAGGISAKDTAIKPGRNSSTELHLGQAGIVLVRPVETATAEARIALNGLSPFKGFNLRVDREKKKQQVSADMGGADFKHAIAYDRAIGQLSQNKQIIMNYSDMIDDKGKLKLTDKTIYPSIMEFADLDIGNRIALFLALSMKEGEEVGIREKDHYSHHSREFVTKPEYYDQFESIANKLIAVFRAKKSHT